MITSGLVVQRRARFEKGFPSEIDQNPRDEIVAPAVNSRDGNFPDKSKWARPRITPDGETDIRNVRTAPYAQTRYKDIFSRSKGLQFIETGFTTARGRPNKAPGLPGQLPGQPGQPAPPGVQGLPGAPQAPEVPGVPGVPGAPQVPGEPQVPGVMGGIKIDPDNLNVADITRTDQITSEEFVINSMGEVDIIENEAQQVKNVYIDTSKQDTEISSAFAEASQMSATVDAIDTATEVERDAGTGIGPRETNAQAMVNIQDARDIIKDIKSLINGDRGVQYHSLDDAIIQALGTANELVSAANSGFLHSGNAIKARKTATALLRGGNAIRGMRRLRVPFVGTRTPVVTFRNVNAVIKANHMKRKRSFRNLLLTRKTEYS